jgi:DNA-binding transcriptional MerR regulator
MARNFFSVSDFARFSRISKDALYHYDKIGLLPPVSRGLNKYRHYSANQLATVNLIRTFQDSGMTLNEIKILIERRTPEHLDDLLTQMMKQVDDKLDEWSRTKKLLAVLQKSIHSALNIDDEAITIQFMHQEAITLGDSNDYSENRNDYDALLKFYHSTSTKYPDLDLNYPVWATFSGERIKRGDWKWPDRYYLYNPDGRDTRPAALYAIAYQRGSYGQTDALYKRLIDYIDKHGFEICGDAYEEYPLNEICISDDTNYLIRVMIAVRERRQET